MSGENDHLVNPDAVSWDELRAEFQFTAEEEAEITRRGDEMLARVRAHRLAELPKRKHVAQTEVAEEMGIAQARVSKSADHSETAGLDYSRSPGR